jgi:hypothetical protein
MRIEADTGFEPAIWRGETAVLAGTGHKAIRSKAMLPHKQAWPIICPVFSNRFNSKCDGIQWASHF